MQAGLLNETIKMLRPYNTISAFGEDVQNYRLNNIVRVRVKNDNGKRSTVNDEIVNIYQKTFVVRQYEDIRDTDLIEYQDKRYRILSNEIDRQDQSRKIIAELIINE